MLKIKGIRILERTGILKYINPDEYERLVSELDFQVVKYVNKQIVFRQNEKVEQLAIVIDGIIRGQKIHGVSYGEMAHVYDEGEIFAYEGILSSSRIAPLDYISDGDSQVMFIELESIKKSSFSKDLMHGLAGYMADDSIRKSYRIEAISKKKLRERLLTFLKIRIQETGSNSVTLNMTREELAQELCVNRSALSKELGDMQRDEIIVISKGKITLL